MGNCIGRVSNDNESDYLQFGLFNAYQQYRLTIENIAEQLKHAKKILVQYIMQVNFYKMIQTLNLL